MHDRRPATTACLHTADSNVAILEAARRDLGLGDAFVLRHEIRAGLLSDAEAAFGLTPAMRAA